MQLGDGTRTDFWGETWCGLTPLKEKFPYLFEIYNEQEVPVSDISRNLVAF
jgi:hypothetical protein